MKRIIRVFPRATSATPDDGMAFVGDPPLEFVRPEADEVLVSCTFTWDRREAERLAKAWGRFYADVRLGGPAFGDGGGEFVPGRFLRKGFTITTRGCPNACDHCLVPEREGGLRLLQIKPGWDVVDNNLLAAPWRHIEAVLAMLEDQPRRARFSGGLEAGRLERWFVQRLVKMRLHKVFVAYDRLEQVDDVVRGIEMLRDAGLEQRQVGCYVLVGFKGDDLDRARGRLEWMREVGATPYAMYFRGPNDGQMRMPREWAALVREYSRPRLIFGREVQAQAEGQLF